MSLKLTTYFAVGQTPASAPDPWSGPSQNAQNGGRRGRRPRSRGTAPHADFFNALRRRDTREPVDYPDFAEAVGKAVLDGRAARGDGVAFSIMKGGGEAA